MRFIALVVVMLLASLRLGAQATQTAADESQSVMNLENAWNQAVAVHDEAALKGMLAETFVFTDNDGRFMDRDQWLRRVRIETKDNRGPANITQTAHAYGNAVIVTGSILDKTRVNGENVDVRSRFTDTWIFQNRHWECVAGQLTLAPR